MIETEIFYQKRSKTTPFEKKPEKTPQKWKRSSVLSSNDKNYEKFISNEIKNKQKWSKKQEENLLISLFQNIIEEPYMEFSWKFYEDSKSLGKICRKLKKSLDSGLKMMNQMKSVNQQNYYNLDFIDFLLAYWKAKNFRNKIGNEHAEKIKELKSVKSDHMTMCQQKMKNMTLQQTSFMELYNLIMRN